MFRNIFSNLPIYLLRIPVILIALTFHEAAHGWMAAKMGDSTAEDHGRITLNPLKHLDPIGVLCMLLFGFGWARPVPITARNFRNPRRGMALTALAGPLSNLLLGFIGVLVFRIARSFTPPTNYLTYALLLFLSIFYTLNIALAVFNLIPIPPFDGSRILFAFLPDKLYFGIMKYERIIMIVLLLLLWTNILTIPLSGAVNGIVNIFYWITGFIPGLV